MRGPVQVRSMIYVKRKKERTLWRYVPILMNINRRAAKTLWHSSELSSNHKKQFQVKSHLTGPGAFPQWISTIEHTLSIIGRFARQGTAPSDNPRVELDGWWKIRDNAASKRVLLWSLLQVSWSKGTGEGIKICGSQLFYRTDCYFGSMHDFLRRICSRRLW